eukprot:7381341-Prymnesium_polylepis.1
MYVRACARSGEGPATGRGGETRAWRRTCACVTGRRDEARGRGTRRGVRVVGRDEKQEATIAAFKLHALCPRCAHAARALTPPQSAPPQQRGDPTSAALSARPSAIACVQRARTGPRQAVMHAIVLERAVAKLVARGRVLGRGPVARHRAIRPQGGGARDIDKWDARRVGEPAGLL